MMTVLTWMVAFWTLFKSVSRKTEQAKCWSLSQKKALKQLFFLFCPISSTFSVNCMVDFPTPPMPPIKLLLN